MTTIGLDCGATKILGLAIGDDGAVVAEHKVSTPDGGHGAVDAMTSVVDGLRDTVGDVDGVGVAAAGWVDRDRTTMLHSPHLPAFTGVPLATLLADRVGLPVVLENDANAATWAEHRFGAGTGTGDMVLVTVGSGVGGGMVTGGRLVRGARGVAGEIGHAGVNPDGPPCPCGNTGCLDSLASGRALERHYAALAPALPGDRITALAHDGDPLALAAFDTLARWLAVGLTSVTMALDPEVIVLGAGSPTPVTS